MKTTAFLALLILAVSSVAAPVPEETSPLQIPDYSAMVTELADKDIGLVARFHFADGFFASLTSAPLRFYY